MKKNKELIITTLICILPMVFSTLLYNKLPEKLVTHWGSDGTPNGWSSKAFVCFGMPILFALLNIVVNFTLEYDPKKKNSAPIMKLIIKWSVPVISVFTITITLLSALNYDISVETIVPIIVGVLFIAIGNYLPKCKQNYTIGIKCPWTLHSEENWNKTHHLSGYLFILGGIFMIMSGIFYIPSIIVLLVILFIAFFPILYSFLVYRKDGKNHIEKE